MANASSTTSFRSSAANGWGGYPGLLALIEPERVLHSFLEEKTRPDGRQLWEERKIDLEPGAVTLSDGPYALNAGSGLARVGETQAFCSIGLNLATAGDPVLTFHVSVGTSGRDATWARQVEILLTETYASFPRTDRWLLSLSVTCLTDDGSLVDCCALAVIAALADARLPDTKDGDVIEVLRRGNTPLPCVFAIPLTCAVLDRGEGMVALVDPTIAEERLSTLVTVLLAPSTHLILKLRQQPGGPYAATRSVLLACVKLAMTRSARISARLAALVPHRAPLLVGKALESETETGPKIS